ncbi:ABC transporter permease [Streptomyces alkaliphilus]|uniref:ABC transporter permease n=1 Tax=Streptomyces alkaliphilus TaxID=1472722 RepID=A0A7W3Y325_9ACTN|nr:ABC transporter permease [Streptomyces alkaliphilus]MBB0245877.1 ABC transporter permease [Streptomyces alkaliphilus]
MTATRPAPATEPAPTRGDSLAATLAGTGILLRFALRRDRVRMAVWAIGLVLGTAMSAASFEGAYTDEAARQSLIESTAVPAGLALTGPAEYLTDYTYASMLAHQMIGFTGVLIALMAVLTVTRHSRDEEETGRSELLRAGVLGRHAQLTAALAAAAVSSLIVGLLMALSLIGLDMEGTTASGALLYGLAHTAVALVFAGAAAVTVQLTAHTRAASGMALAAVGAAYALRAAGDATGDLAEGGAGGGVWLSWLSPIGWAQRTFVFVEDRWWPLLLCLAPAAALAALGYVLSTHRDVGAGLWAARGGRPRASGALAHPFGLALRLQRGLLIGFTIGVALLGAMYGSVIGEVEGMLGDVDVIQDSLAQLGGATLAESFVSMVLIPLSTVAAVYAVLASLRIRAEETGGRAESLLATGLSRARWVGGHLAVALLGSTAALVAGGLVLGVTGALALGDGGLVGSVLGASLAYGPALWMTVGVTAVLIGWAPRASVVAWVVPVGAFVLGYLGTLLDFPQWLINLSPFTHVPRLPAREMAWTPLLVLTALAAGLLWLGLVGLRRRDLELK